MSKILRVGFVGVSIHTIFVEDVKASLIPFKSVKSVKEKLNHPVCSSVHIFRDNHMISGP
jgi:hypothetical protein